MNRRNFFSATAGAVVGLFGFKKVDNEIKVVKEIDSMATVNVKKLEWGDLIDLPGGGKGKYYPLHDGQDDVLHSTTRFTAAIAGTGGGKTVLGPIWLAKQILRVQELGRPGLFMVLAPTYKVLQRATVPTMIESFKGTNLEGRYYENKNMYLLPDGGKIWCQGTDNPGGIEGGQFDAIWGDEAGQFSFKAWTAIQGRVGQKQAPVLFTTTPYGRNWLFSDFYNRYKSGDRDYYCRQWASKVNPAYPDEEYNRAKRTLSPAKAAMRYDGEFMKMEGLVYDFDDCLVDDVSPSEVLLMPGKFYGGIDFGWNDPFAALLGNVDRSDILWLFYERYKSETEIEKHAKRLPKFAGRGIRWFADPSRPDSIKKLRKGGHRVFKAARGIEDGIDAVQNRVRTGRLRILVNQCPALMAESEIYAYKEEDEFTKGDKPEDGDDHTMDSLRYLISGLDKKKAA